MAAIGFTTTRLLYVTFDTWEQVGAEQENLLRSE